MNKPDTTELRLWIAEALKRNDRTYAALEQIVGNLPDGEDGESPLHTAWAAAEEAQQTVRRRLIEMHDRALKNITEGGKP